MAEKIKMTPDIEIAKSWYGDKTNTTGTLLIEHVVEVAEILDAAIKSTNEFDEPDVRDAYRVALAHDVLEDTKTTEKNIEMEWGSKVLAHVRELSNKKGDADFDDYIEYLANKASELSILVKFADIIANVNNTIRHSDSIDVGWVLTFWLPLLDRYEQELLTTKITDHPETAKVLKLLVKNLIEELKKIYTEKNSN